MPVTLAIPFRDHKRPPAVPPSSAPVAPSAAPPPLPSMRVPKGTHSHDASEAEETSLEAAILKARRKTEELEWQAQVARAKSSLAESEDAEWLALHARMAAAPAVTPPRPRARPQKPTTLLSRVPRTLAARPADNVLLARGPARFDQAERQAEEREWQELRARARVAEEREWEELIARARTTTAQPLRPLHSRAATPLDVALVPGTARLDRPSFARGALVAWP